MLNKQKGKFLLGLSFAALLLTGCAEKLPNKKPQDFDRDVHSLSKFSSPIKMKTAKDTALALEAPDSLSKVYALNALELRTLEFTNEQDAKELGGFFQNLQIPSSKEGEEFTIVFKNTQSYMIAYFVVEPGRTLTREQEEISEIIDGQKLVPLFYYGINGYGRVENSLNQYDEETRFLHLRPTTMSAASHVRISAREEYRKYSGLRGYTSEKVLTKSVVNGRIWSADELTKVFKFRNENEFAEQAPNYVTYTVNDKLYFLSASTYEGLDVAERAYRKNNSRLVQRCNANIAKNFGLDINNCYLSPEYQVSISQVALDNNYDVDGNLTGSLKLDYSVDSESADFFMVKKNKFVSQSNLARDLSFEDKNLYNKDDFQGMETAGKNAATAFGIPALSTEELVETKLVNKTLWYRVPRKLSNLSVFEKAAIETDPRYDSCSETQALATGIEKENCALVPLYYRSVTLASTRIDHRDENQDPKLIVDRGVLPEQADIFEVKNNKKATAFDYNRGREFADDIVVNIAEQFDQNAEYLYVPMTMDTPRANPQAKPFQQGNEKIVRMKFDKNGFHLYEQDKDDRFKDNTINDSPVLSIGGRYVDYRCSRDDRGNCNTGIETVTDKSWSEKRFFIPNMDRPSIKEANTLSYWNVDGSGCARETRRRLVYHEVKKGVFNFEIEKEYKLNDSWQCIANNFLADTTNFMGLKNNTFKARFFFSIVKLEKMASKNYKPVYYPEEEHDSFGFFKNRNDELNDVFDPSRPRREFLLNRWNTESGFVRYHLSETYTFDRNYNLLVKSIEVFKQINISLQKANAGFQLKLVLPVTKEKPFNEFANESVVEFSTEAPKKAGDLQNSMLVLIDEPLDSGLLGYAPAVANPRTGEIVQSHVNMYSGTLTQMVRNTWAEMVILSEKLHAEKQAAMMEEIQRRMEEAGQVPAEPTAPAETPEQMIADFKVHAHNHSHDHVANTSMKKRLNELSMKSANKMRDQIDTYKQLFAEQKRRGNVTPIIQKTFESQLDDLESLAKQEENRLMNMAMNNAFSIEFFKIANTVKAVIPEVLEIEGVTRGGKSDQRLKDWNDLTEAQRLVARDIVVDFNYASTLSHEMGHSLGLRHNFNGSWDKENFYTQEEINEYFPELVAKLDKEIAEARQRGEDTTELEKKYPNIPAYSSVMDYSMSPLNGLAVLGKYDVAALRYAYAREVEVTKKDGTTGFVKLATTLTDLEKSIEEPGYMASVKAEVESRKNDQYLSRYDKMILALNENDVIEASSNAGDIASVKEYGFCTDQNAGLGLTCNRFDEGTTYSEVIKSMMDSHNDNHRWYNFRNKRLSFTYYNIYRRARWKNYQFGKIRDMYETFELYSKFYGADLMAQGCSPQQTAQYPVCVTINDIKDATELAGNFLVGVATAPEHTCATQNPETKQVAFYSLEKIFLDNLRWDIDYAPTSCFDPAVVKKMQEGFTIGEQRDLKGTPIAEAGEYFNSFNINDPIHKYSNDIHVLGTWQDKIIAMKQLMRRRNNKGTEEDEFGSFYNHPTIGPKVRNILEHLTLGVPLAEPVKFTLANGQKVDVPYSFPTDLRVQNLSKSYSSLMIRKMLNLNLDGDTSFAQAMTVAGVVNNWSLSEKEAKEASVERNEYTVIRVAPHVSINLEPGSKEIYIDNKRYIAAPRHTVAYTMMTVIEEAQNLKEFSTEDIQKVIELRENPERPSDLTENEIFLLDIAAPITLDMAIGWAQQGLKDLNDAPELLGQIRGIYGDEVTDKLVIAFKELGLEGMLALKEKVGTPQLPSDATDAVKALWEKPIQILKGFLEGVLDQQAEAYQQKIQYLPLDFDFI